MTILKTTNSAAPMAKLSENLIDLTEPAPSPYSEPSILSATDEASNIDAVVPDYRSRIIGLPSSSLSYDPSSDYTDAPENLGIRGLVIGDPIHEPSDVDEPDAESQQASFPQ